MFFVPSIITFEIRGIYSPKLDQLALERSEISVPYLPWEALGSDVPLKIIDIVQETSRKLNPRWWLFENAGSRGNLRLANLVFQGSEFIDQIRSREACHEDEVLYQTILREGRIEIAVQDAENPKRVTCLFVNLTYGQPKDC
jgi:hypothetical protein